jgi:all-trans-8'-apo-beta-carotenal 15,15'-oxygenase
MITKFSFVGGKALYSNRYVETEEWKKETAAQKMLYRSFGTNLPGGFVHNFMKTRFKNASNTSVIWHGGRLLSLWEGGLPHEIDPFTLETISRFDYDGALQNQFSWLDRKILPEMAFSAHPKIHPDTGALHNFGTVAGVKQRLVQYTVAADGQMLAPQVKELPAVAFTHDFILTARERRIFFFTPVEFGLLKMFLGFAPPVASMRVKKQAPIEIMLFDAATNREFVFETDFGFIFHFTNGYDLGENRVVVDGFMMPDFPGAEVNKKLFAGDDSGTPAGRLTRFILNLDDQSVERSILSPYLGELPSFHPALTGKAYQYVWSLGLPAEADYQILDGIQKVDVQRAAAKVKSLHPHLPGEPLFIPKPGAKAEDEGYLATMVFNSVEKSTWLYLFDARNLEEITKARLPHNIPVGFHGKFVEEIF